MQQIPPWTTPASYCQAVNSWTVVDTSSLGPGQQCSPGSQLCQDYTFHVWASDQVFCLSGTTDLWQVFLYLAGALWVFVTVLKLFHTFDWRGLTGFRVGEIVKALGGQTALLLVAVSSFGLLLLVHQLNFSLINALVGSLPDQRVDSLWAKLDTLLTASQQATQHLDPNGWASSLFGGNLPDSSAPFGLTWGQIFGGLGSLESFLLGTLLPVRFAALFVAVVSAPLAMLAVSLPSTRRFFFIWLEFWLEIEALAAGSAIVLAAYQQLHTPLLANGIGKHGLDPAEQALILLAFAGLVCGANLAFLWKIVGQFLTQIAGFYQQQYQRERQFWGILAQAAVGLAGAIATVATGGAALPVALAAEGLVSGVEELGAVPASAVPGSGMGHALLSAGGAAAWRAGAGTRSQASGTTGTGGGSGGGQSGSPAVPGTSGSGSGPAVQGPPLPGPTAAAGPGVPGGAGTPLSPASPFPPSAGNVPPGTAAGGSGGQPAPPGVPPGTTSRSQTVLPTWAPRSGGPGGGPSAQPPPAQVAPLGGSGAFAGLTLSPRWSAQSTGQQASRQAAHALPEVLSQMPLRSAVQQSLFAPWHTSRGEEIDATAVFQSYFWNAVCPDAPLHYTWQGKAFLRVSTPAGLDTGVPLEAIERRLQGVPYLADTLELHRRGWIRPEDVTPVAEALGNVYHAQPHRAYRSQAEQVRDFLVGTASAQASDPDHGASALLQFIGGLLPPGGKRP